MMKKRQKKEKIARNDPRKVKTKRMWGLQGSSFISSKEVH